MLGDADLLNSVLTATDIVISDAELVNFDWVRDLNYGVKPKIFIAVEGRQGEPKKGCFHTLTIPELMAILIRIEANNEAKNKAKR